MEIIRLESKGKGERVRFNRIVYRRYPASKNLSDRTYFRCGHGDVLRGFGYLHRDVWRHHHGEIPAGHDIDHDDGDPGNNAISNLVLRSHDNHAAKHRDGHAARSSRLIAERPEQHRAMVEKSKAWHRSPAGRAWHSQHSRKVHAAMAMVGCVCEKCGNDFKTKQSMVHKAIYCSNRCKAAARRASGVDNEPRTCKCGTAFTVNRYSKQRNCSRLCGWRRHGPGPSPRLQPAG